jgi:hypothetical protein
LKKDLAPSSLDFKPFGNALAKPEALLRKAAQRGVEGLWVLSAASPTS